MTGGFAGVGTVWWEGFDGQVLVGSGAVGGEARVGYCWKAVQCASVDRFCCGQCCTAWRLCTAARCAMRVA